MEYCIWYASARIHELLRLVLCSVHISRLGVTQKLCPVERQEEYSTVSHVEIISLLHYSRYYLMHAVESTAENVELSRFIFVEEQGNAWDRALLTCEHSLT